MTEPIKLAIEALENWDQGKGNGVGFEFVDEALAALRSIKPPCQMCANSFTNSRSALVCIFDNCTNFDKFQAMEPICLTKEK